MGSSKDPEAGVVEGQPAYYGTFQGQPNYPQPVPPSQAPHWPSGDHNYNYQQVDGVRPRVAEGRPILGGDYYQREGDLPFCGLGIGWFLFILGFFFFVIPWYIGTFIYFCLRHDYRERSGLLACAVAALIVLVFGGGIGGSKAGGRW